jgi:osmoprotectant transport system substrate-binding protein
VLEDDKALFPPYNIALTMRTDVYEANKDAYDELFGELNPLLTDEQMLELNAAVDVKGQEVSTVAQTFLEDNDIM